MPTPAQIQQLKLLVDEADNDDAKAAALCRLLNNIEAKYPGHKDYVNELFILAGKLNNPLYKAWAQLFLSWNYIDAEPDIKAAKELTDSAFAFFTAQNDLQGQAVAYLLYGRIEWAKDQFAAALEYYFKAVKIYETTADNNKLALAYFYIGHAYSDTFNVELAVTYFEKALPLFRQSGDKITESRCYNNIGANYYYSHKELSLQYHTQALKLAQETGNKTILSFGYYWVGTLRIDKGEFASGEDYLQKAKDLCEEIFNLHILAYTHISLGRLRTINKDYKAAALHFEKAWQLAMEEGNKMWERAVYKEWYLLKKIQGDFEAALDLYEQFVKLDREVSHSELAEKVAAVKFRSDMEKKEKDLEIQNLRNEELEREKELAEQLHRAAEESKRFKEQFLANMSHEIRTPMNAVLGMTNLLLDGEMSEKQKNYLYAVKRSSENLLVILNDILDLSKLEAGKMDLEKLPFKLAEQVEHTMDMLRFKAEEKGLLFTSSIAADVPDVVTGDAPRLNQILINIISNAIKFTEKGSVKLAISGAAPGLLKFSVTDTGIGLTPQQQTKIFDSFAQAESSTNRKYGGTGLGLAICKTLVELQGGTIKVKSTPDSGSEFWFTLPYTAASEKDIVSSDITNLTDYSALSKLKILVAEDYEFNQVVIKDTLEHLLPGITVEIAANGKIAIEKLTQGNYDMVLMDVQMPEMDGYEATRYIRNNLKMDIPIIALTASVIRSDLDKCTDAGMNGYIPKPFERDILLKELMKQNVYSV